MLALLGAAPLAATGVLASSGTAHARTGRQPADDPALDAAIQRIIGRPEFQGARWAMAFHSLDDEKRVYSMNPGELFVAGSAYKVFVAGTAFEALGAPGHRFRTRVYRTGPVSRGVLHGDLVLVAGCDLLIGGRMRPDGTLALPDPDHTYGTTPGAAAAPGDPLAVLREIAGEVAARGIRRVTGRVLVDVSLFREAPENIGNGGIPITVSPMMVNDNVVDVTVTPGAASGAPAVLHVSPDIGYVRVVNEVRTIAASGTPGPGNLAFTGDTANPDGTRTVTLTGDIPVDTPHLFRAYYVPSPVRFAQTAFAQALRDSGIEASVRDVTPAPAAHHPDRNRLAEHVSLPLPEQLMGMLKVSSNPHAVAWPYIVGAVADGEPDNPVAAYEARRRRLYEQAGLDPDSVSEQDHLYTSDFFIGFLSHLWRQSYFPRFRSALPIMGRDGTLANVQVDSPAAGHVHAKTGTSLSHGSTRSVSSALAGYIDLPDGRSIAFAEFVYLPTDSPESQYHLTGEVLGELATTVYLSQS
ncbi:D-alanyl-D-alanine carboxypeptidase/D-alanyl-D-alanine-endopeptidase [Jiangella asiatica]|nr:D-alanyl-D-alanine carboxypeptidase/D-alanyl-D-alanine-endopeptidase [Jiangella asiatica]